MRLGRKPVGVYHAGKLHPINSTPGLLASRLRGTRLWMERHDYGSTSTRFGENRQKWIVSLFDKKMPHQPKRLTANTYFTVHRLCEMGIPVDLHSSRETNSRL